MEKHREENIDGFVIITPDIEGRVFYSYSEALLGKIEEILVRNVGNGNVTICNTCDSNFHQIRRLRNDWTDWEVITYEKAKEIIENKEESVF